MSKKANKKQQLEQWAFNKKMATIGAVVGVISAIGVMFAIGFGFWGILKPTQPVTPSP